MCIIILAVYWLPIRFDELQLFGIKPDKGYLHTRALVVWTLWLLWLYHILLFIFFAQRDWKDWRARLREGDVEMPRRREAYPEVRMYFPRWRRFWGHPSKALSAKYLGNEAGEWKNSESEGGATWLGRNQTGQDKRFRIPVENARSVRSRVRWYLLVEWGVPMALSLMAIYAGVAKHLCWPEPTFLG